MNINGTLHKNSKLQKYFDSEIYPLHDVYINSEAFGITVLSVKRGLQSPRPHVNSSSANSIVPKPSRPKANLTLALTT